MLCSPWLKPPKTLVPMFWESVLAGVCTDQHNNTHPGAVCSPCCHLTKDREVSAALPPDYGAAAVRLLNSSSTPKWSENFIPKSWWAFVSQEKKVIVLLWRLRVTFVFHNAGTSSSTRLLYVYLLSRKEELSSGFLRQTETSTFYGQKFTGQRFQFLTRFPAGCILWSDWAQLTLSFLRRDDVEG